MSEARLHTPPIWDVPGHEVRKVLKHAPNQGRTVLLTRYGKTDCVTRVWHSPVSVHEHESLYRIAAGHSTEGCPFPPDLVSDLEGYRVRASLGQLPFLPDVVNVGLVRRDFNSEAYPYISTRWIEGRPLHATWRGFGVATRKRILRETLRALDVLHSHNVLHGDLKAENIVVNDGAIALIDLDTLRRVPDRDSAVAVSQLTALYSSPEQSHDRKAYLASDLFAYGVMVGLLLGNCRPGQQGFPPQLDAPWGAVLEACLREKAQDRPQASELLRAVVEEGEPPASIESSSGAPVDVNTVRVPDSVSARPPRVVAEPSLTERVVDAGEPALVSAPPRRKRRRVSTFPSWVGWILSMPQAVLLLLRSGRSLPRFSPRVGWSAAGIAVIAAFVVTAIARSPGDERVASPELAGLRAQLQRHKTELASNNRKFLAPIVAEAREASFADDAAEVWGVYALARVWQQGWQYTGARWNHGMFSEGDALTAQALDMAATPEALLARAILTGAACRLAPGSYARRADHCAESRLRSDQLLRRVDADWLRVEVLWNAALVERAEAASQFAAGRDREALRHVAAGLEYCNTARKILPASPINGVEMAEDCVMIASRARDAEAWLWWVGWVVGHGDQAGKDRARVADHVFRSVDPRCAGNPSAALQARFAAPGQGTFEYCAYVANMGLGCRERAAQFVCPAGSGLGCELPLPTDDVPWDFASSVSHYADDRACAIP